MKRLFRGWSWEHWYNLAREDLDAAYDSVRRAVRIGVLAGLALWSFSGLHAVRQNEVGLVTFCGALTGQEKPGLHYRFPWPIGSLRRVPVQTQQRVVVGMAATGLTADERMGKVTTSVMDTNSARQLEGKDETEDSLLDELMKEGQRKQTGEAPPLNMGNGLPLLTADHNVIQVQAVVQYIIADPVKYIYRTEGSDLLLRRAATHALLVEAARTRVDDLLTTARTQVQSRVQQAIAEQVDRLPGGGIGVRVAGVELQRVVPPDAVAASFRNVNTAREERNTVVNEAQQYASTVVPEARGNADALVQDARAYRAKRVAEARGEWSRFQGVLREFQNSGRIVGERLRFETLETIMGRANKVQVGGAQDSINLHVVEPKPQGEE